MGRKFKTSNQTILLVLTFLIAIASTCSSAQTHRGVKMTNEEYYTYLRNDTSICELPNLEVNKSFLVFLDTLLLNKEEYKKCNSDLNPFVYSIEENIQNDKLFYYVETLFSTNSMNHFYSGAFNYKGEIFVVKSNSETNSAFHPEGKNQMVKIFFCNRIHHPKYKYIAKIKDKEICIECLKNEIIKIK